MKNFCETLPEDRLLHGYDHDLMSIIKDEKQRAYTIPSTGAKLTYRHAIHILDRYATSLVSVIKAPMYQQKLISE
jgi:endoribonuclease Dicer